MRSFGARSFTDLIPVPPDTVNTLLIAGSSGQAMDWPSGSSVGGIARLTGFTTAGAQLNFMANLYSTACAAPASGSSVTSGSSGNNLPILGRETFQIPGNSTGFSIAALSSGYVMVEVWKKGG